MTFLYMVRGRWSPTRPRKLERLDALSELRRLLGLPASKSCGAPLIFHPVAYEGRRRALLSEAALVERRELLEAEVDWLLEAATTTAGAEEGYDLSRLAWLGDAVVFFVAVQWCSAEEGELKAKQRRAAALISNRSRRARTPTKDPTETDFPYHL